MMRSLLTWLLILVPSEQSCIFECLFSIVADMIFTARPLLTLHLSPSSLEMDLDLSLSFSNSSALLRHLVLRTSP